MARRVVLRPKDATTDGERRLREMALQTTFASMAKRARCDETAVRRWARGESMPSPKMRVRIRETLGILEEAWSEAWSDPPPSDVSSEPETARP